METLDNKSDSDMISYKILAIRISGFIFALATFYVWLIQLTYFRWGMSWIDDAIFTLQCVAQILILLLFFKNNFALRLLFVGLVVSILEIILKWCLNDPSMFFYEIFLQGTIYGITFYLLYNGFHKCPVVTKTNSIG
jgi:hypothetical protein